MANHIIKRDDFERDIQGLKQGEGKEIYHDGEWYKGFYTNNKRGPKGEYHWSDTRFYKGDWVEGRQEGSGFMQFTPGLFHFCFILSRYSFF